MGGKCYHVYCVQSVLKTEYLNKSFSLSVLKKHIRTWEKEGKSGRKKPRKLDLDTNIFPAPDSEISKRGLDTDSINDETEAEDVQDDIILIPNTEMVHGKAVELP